MNLQLANKVVLVTGSTKGIGFAIAQQLHAEGCQVILNGRDSDALESALAELPEAMGFTADVSVPDQADRLVTEVVNACGQLDGLVCNVGSGRSVLPGDEYFEEWQRVFAINVWSTTNMVEASSRVLAISNGAIVCISSICGQEVVSGAPVTYSSAKAALNAYVRGISRPLGKRGVRINAIAPGNIFFEGSVWERKLHDSADVIAEMLNRDVSLGKLGTPEDVANLTAYLLSPLSSFATGSVLTLDGGQVHS